MNDLINLIPPQLRVYVAIGAIALPYITRAFYGLRNGGGLRGIWRSIWFGNNPK